MSATLQDKTAGDFRYVKRSLGVNSNAKEIVVSSPFDYRRQQLVYITPGKDEVEQVVGAQYSLDELKTLIKATDGRTLVLFTSRMELNDAADKLRAASDFPWTLLVQEHGADKAELGRMFKEDTHSVLLGTKSFFTGFDPSGDSCSLVAVVKYPNLQYSPLTKAQVTYWRKNGFPNWYTLKSLEVFTQAAGRLIRSSDCKGTVALLDQRASHENNSIYSIVHESIPKIYAGSEITDDVSKVKTFLTS